MTIAFVDGRIFLGNGDVLDNAAVVVEGEYIAAVSDQPVSLPPDTRRIPLAGHTLFPGFIDCHVHLTMNASPDPITAIQSMSTAALAIQATRMARRTLMAGVTTVRDMGGPHGVDLALRQAIAAGWVPGPRMQASAKLICMTGGHGWQIGCEADGPDAVRRAARRQIKAGADLVKLMATGGVLTDGVEPGSAQLTEAELRAGIEEAHKVGKKTASHAMGTQGVKNALRAGIDSIEHGVYLDDECVEIMARRGVFYIPTLSASYHIEKNGTAAGIPVFAVEKNRRVSPHMLASLEMARRAGVPIAMGTDAGTPFNRHGGNLREICLLAGQGFSAIEAFQAATGMAAQAMGLSDQLGTIGPGKLADLVLVRDNPLDNIELILEADAIRLVMQGGRIVHDVAD